MAKTIEKIIPAEGIFLSIIHGESGDLITNDFTPFAELSNDEIIELVETDTQLYIAERKRLKAARRAKERNRVKIALIRFIRAI